MPRCSGWWTNVGELGGAGEQKTTLTMGSADDAMAGINVRRRKRRVNRSGLPWMEWTEKRRQAQITGADDAGK